MAFFNARRIPTFNILFGGIIFAIRFLMNKSSKYTSLFLFPIHRSVGNALIFWDCFLHHNIRLYVCCNCPRQRNGPKNLIRYGLCAKAFVYKCLFCWEFFWKWWKLLNQLLVCTGTYATIPVNFAFVHLGTNLV